MDACTIHYIMYQFEQNNAFLDAAIKLSAKHNVKVSEILSVAKKTEENKRMTTEDLLRLQNEIGIPLGLKISKREVSEGSADCNKFQESIISIANQEYTFEKLDCYPNFIWAL